MKNFVQVREISYRDPLAIFSRFAEQPYALFLDSAQITDRLGRYSFIAADPFLTMISKYGQILLGREKLQGNPFKVLARQINQFAIAHRSGLPPFQTGVAGYFGYDLRHHLEELPKAHVDDMEFPDMVMGFYDVVIAFDHLMQRAWIFSSGYPESDTRSQRKRALDRIQEFEDKIDQAPVSISIPQPVNKPAIIQSNFKSRERYEDAVQQVIDYIYAGDIFQANLSQRFKAKLPSQYSPFTLYRRLRAINPAPFAAYLNFEDVVIASASPERFLLLRDNWIETRPIKGTRPRGTTVESDQKFATALLRSEKDRAENVMIVDLVRNDLSRVCQNHTVNTPEICVLESYATVHHLVSKVEGQLKPGKTAIDLLQAAFPGGSITGAPKIRAMEIINELEPTQRGPYCGSVGYISFSGDMDTSIIIRTYAIKEDLVTFQAGGGIVADSNPAAEYDETLDKARALIHALQ
ncbi:MAG: aminodeoxychorismate synthase component I [Anaerolineae bacterium]|nr:aminodeoxychorismate synthase component I [Anaerolineae bacterium]